MIAKIDTPDFRIGAQFFGAALPEYFPTFQDVCVIRYAKSFADVMIGIQHAKPRLRQAPDNLLEVLHRERVDTRERVREWDKGRLEGRGTGNFAAAAFPAG